MQEKQRHHSRKYTRQHRYRVRQLIIRSAIAVLCVICVMTAVIVQKSRKKEAVPPEQNSRKNQTVAEESKPVIVLDPGHGGKDSGSEWGEITEKDINLAVVKETAKILESDGFTVVLTRRSDTKVSKDARVKLAEEKKADVFVSVHQNYVDDDTTSHGIETYCNASVNGRSAVLAGKVQAAVTAETSARDRDVNTESDFVVVQSQKVPSCLIETGFLTSDEERPLLISEAYQKKLAAGIAKGISDFLRNL